MYIIEGIPGIGCILLIGVIGYGPILYTVYDVTGEEWGIGYRYRLYRVYRHGWYRGTLGCIWGLGVIGGLASIKQTRLYLECRIRCYRKDACLLVVACLHLY